MNPHRRKLQELEGARRRVAQTFTTGPGYVSANLGRCSSCRLQVTLRSLEVFHDDRGRELWLCCHCAEARR